MVPLPVSLLMRTSAAGAFNLQRRGWDLELMGAEAAVRAVLGGEVVGECARRQLRGRAEGSRGMALLAGEARGRGAGSALAAVQYLGEIARGESARGPRRDGTEGLLAHKMLEAQLAVDLGAFQHAARFRDVDYVL
jgi:hypothetical protein